MWWHSGVNGHQSDYYVGLNFYDRGSIAIIYGFATKEDIKNAIVGKWDKINPVDDYTILYKDLKPIKNLLLLIPDCTLNRANLSAAQDA